MSRREKFFQVIEEEKTINGKSVSEYYLKNKSLGQVVVGKPYVVVLPDGQEITAKSEHEALDYLIRHYHLHVI